MLKKAVALLSGGLDSILAIKLMQEQGIEIQAVNFSISFCACSMKDGENAATKAAKKLNVPIEVFDITEEYLDVLKAPVHGYGANINPCIDCKIFMLKKTKAMLANYGASFIVTGEVLGERPMSQRLDALNIIERDAGVRGILLRPLSAKLLVATIPEKEGIVNREQLLDISGRSRKPQMSLAEKYGVIEYPSPAGGCLLTDPGFTRRVQDLIGHNSLTIENLSLLEAGRHFRLTPKAKLIIGRDEGENDMLEAKRREGDLCFILRDLPGPFCVLRGDYDEETIQRAAAIAAYHTKFRTQKTIEVMCWMAPHGEERIIRSAPASQEEVSSIRI